MRALVSIWVYIAIDVQHNTKVRNDKPLEADGLSALLSETSENDK